MSDHDALSDCFHFWRAVDSRRSQCSKCGEIRRSPCDEPECVALRARVAELEALLREAVEDIKGWAGYASAYFQDKHDLPGCLARYRSALAQQEGEG